MGCLYLFRADNALKRHERLCGSNDYCPVEMPTKDDYCPVEMPTKDNKTLKYNRKEKSVKAPFTIYADLGCLVIKEQSSQNNSNESHTERKAKHEPLGYSLSLISAFDKTKNIHSVYRGKDCIKTFCSDLKELVTKIIIKKKK